MQITREFLRQHHACYTDQEIAALVPADGLSLSQILDLRIPEKDRIWVATLPSVCPPQIMWVWQALLVERALARVANPDPRSLAVVPLLRRLAAGENVGREEISRASYAAYAAYADGAAYAASRAAYASAYAAAAYAASDAASDAEHKQQIADLKRLLSEEP